MQQQSGALPPGHITESGSASHTNLPMSLTPLIGREHEVAEIGAILWHPEVSLLPLTETGGVGKTRLAHSPPERQNNNTDYIENKHTENRCSSFNEQPTRWSLPIAGRLRST